MRATIKIDRAGRLVLPKPFRERMGLKGGALLRLVMVGEHLELSPEEREESPPLVKKGGLLVVASSGQSSDVVEAMRQDRDEREEILSGRSS